jgi:ABC-type transporter Mla subunit MlaD
MTDVNERQSLAAVANAIEAGPPPAQSVQDYAPKTEEDKIQSHIKNTADVIRNAIKTTAAHVLALVEDAEIQTKSLRQEAEDFIKEVTEVGEVHAQRIEAALGSVKTAIEVMNRQREAIQDMFSKVNGTPKAPTQ